MSKLITSKRNTIFLPDSNRANTRCNLHPSKQWSPPKTSHKKDHLGLFLRWFLERFLLGLELITFRGHLCVFPSLLFLLHLVHCDCLLTKMFTDAVSSLKQNNQCQWCWAKHNLMYSIESWNLPRQHQPAVSPSPSLQQLGETAERWFS